MMTTRITLIRHGETSWNVIKRWQGHADIDLNGTGRMQAAEAGFSLLTAGVQRIISSDLSRAHETAQIINRYLNIPLTTDTRLREIHVGDLQGLTSEEVETRYPAWSATFKNLPYLERHFPNGESFADVGGRALKCLNEAVTAYPQQHTLLVTHGGVVRVLLKKLLDLTPEDSMRNCGITRLIWGEGLWMTEGVNQPWSEVVW
jgi:probable phosphoglycerate mutase